MLNVLKKLKENREESRLLEEWILTNKAAVLLGKMVGARPYFMSFEEYKKQRADGGNKVYENTCLFFRELLILGL